MYFAVTCFADDYASSGVKILSVTEKINQTIHFKEYRIMNIVTTIVHGGW